MIPLQLDQARVLRKTRQRDLPQLCNACACVSEVAHFREMTLDNDTGRNFHTRRLHQPVQLYFKRHGHLVSLRSASSSPT